MVDFIMRQLGIHAIISLVIYFVCIALAFQAIKAVRIEKIIRTSRVFEAQVFLIFTAIALGYTCLLYTSPSPRDVEESRMPSSA